MGIQTKSYYFGALMGVLESKESEAKLFENYSLFRHEGYIESTAEFLTESVALPLLSNSYSLLGTITSSSLGLLSSTLAKRTQRAWYDPISTETLLKIIRGAVTISEPLAHRSPINLPLIWTVDKCFIGLMQLLDVALKDSKTILKLPVKAKKLFSQNALNGFLSETTTVSSKLNALGPFILYGTLYLPLIVMRLAVKAISFVFNQLFDGGVMINWAEKKIISLQDRIDNNFFLEHINKIETKRRKRFFKILTYNSVEKLLQIATKLAIRGLIGRAIILSITSAYNTYGSSNEINMLFHWIVKNATVTTLSGLSLFLTVNSVKKFFTKIYDCHSIKYKPKKHSLFYGKNLIIGFFNLERLTNYFNLNANK